MWIAFCLFLRVFQFMCVRVCLKGEKVKKIIRIIVVIGLTALRSPACFLYICLLRFQPGPAFQLFSSCHGRRKETLITLFYCLILKKICEYTNQA